MHQEKKLILSSNQKKPTKTTKRWNHKLTHAHHYTSLHLTHSHTQHTLAYKLTHTTTPHSCTQHTLPHKLTTPHSRTKKKRKNINECRDPICKKAKKITKRMSRSVSEKCETDVDICFTKTQKKILNGCRHPFPIFLKQISTSVMIKSKTSTISLATTTFNNQHSTIL